MVRSNEGKNIKKAIVITSINPPTKAVKRFAKCRDYSTIVIGDIKSPSSYSYKDVNFLSINQQEKLLFKTIKYSIKGHYSRKNIGYLYAMHQGANIIIDTDDDNIPYRNFGDNLNIKTKAHFIKTEGWINVYKFFTQKKIWPRGFPLEEITKSLNENYEYSKDVIKNCVIQQFLVNRDPDVDAIFRLTNKSITRFRNGIIIMLNNNSFSPFNSQNTVWNSPAFPLMYLPTKINWRITDILRSIIAQICIRQFNSPSYISFHSPSAYQVRNPHNLLIDFNDEIPVYLQIKEILELLKSLSLTRGNKFILKNITACYKALTIQGFVPKSELLSVEAWCKDCSEILKI